MSKLRPGKKMYVSGGIYLNGYVPRHTIKVKLMQKIPTVDRNGYRWRVGAMFSNIYKGQPMFNDDFLIELFVDEKDLLTWEETIAKKLMQ